MHGLGVNPDWNLIGVLRSALADLGFATLSVQMPVLAADAPRDDYAELFPDASERLAAAATWLRAKGYARIAVVSHSMGAAMVNAWLADAERIPASTPGFPSGCSFRSPRRCGSRCSTSSPSAIFPKCSRMRRRVRRQLRDDGCSAPLLDRWHRSLFRRMPRARLASAIAPFITALAALAGEC